jgi:SAM-dependent methyltransferase
MKNHSDETYDKPMAAIYDAWYSDLDDDMPKVLENLAKGGRALELGIGTGRVALPLQQRGVEIHGIDASEAMIAQLHAKPGGEKIPVTLGNFADVAVDGQFSLIYVVFSTFFVLLTQEEQVRCFENVAHHIDPQGFFVIEAYVPDLRRFEQGQTVRTIHVGMDEVRLEAALLDPINQQITAQKVVLTEQGVQLYPHKVRFAWPSELDLMASMAGLQLFQRWENWKQSPFSGRGIGHISVYRPKG